MGILRTNKSLMSFLPQEEEEETKFKAKDSNYLVTMTDGKKYIIEGWQFKKMLKMLNDSRIEFMSINDCMENKRYIRRFEPTNKRTSEQQAIFDKALEERKEIEIRNDEILTKKKVFDVEFYNSVYGEGNWRLYPSLTKKNREKVLTSKDIEECWNAFKKVYPEEAKEINKKLLYK